MDNRLEAKIMKWEWKKKKTIRNRLDGKQSENGNNYIK